MIVLPARGESMQRLRFFILIATRDKKKVVAQVNGEFCIHMIKRVNKLRGGHTSFASGCVELLPLLEEPVHCLSMFCSWLH